LRVTQSVAMLKFVSTAPRAFRDKLMAPAQSLTQMLNAWRSGDAQASHRFVPQIYAELRALAAQQVRRSGAAADTLQPTALVHEAWLRLGEGRGEITDRAHFFALAALTMRSILVDRARAATRVKRGGEQKRVALDETAAVLATNDEEILLLDNALKQLSAVEPRSAQVIELHYFGGLERDAIAELLTLSLRSVDRSLKLGRAWLARALA
jgi:RNA polymerase sigma factor (TIGR02999 family)